MKKKASNKARVGIKVELFSKVAYTAFNLWLLWMLGNRFLKTYHDTSDTDIAILIGVFIFVTATIYKDWWG